jgi:hypothetical protein
MTPLRLCRVRVRSCHVCLGTWNVCLRLWTVRLFCWERGFREWLRRVRAQRVSFTRRGLRGRVPGAAVDQHSPSLCRGDGGTTRHCRHVSRGRNSDIQPRRIGYIRAVNDLRTLAAGSSLGVQRDHRSARDARHGRNTLATTAINLAPALATSLTSESCRGLAYSIVSTSRPVTNTRRSRPSDVDRRRVRPFILAPQAVRRRRHFYAALAGGASTLILERYMAGMKRGRLPAAAAVNSRNEC